MTAFLKRPTLALVMCAGMLAACGTAPAAESAASSPAPGSGGSMPSPISSPGGGAPASAGPAAEIDACALLTDEEIEELTGQAVSSATPGTHLGILENGCEWELGADEMGLAPAIGVGILSPGGRELWDTSFAILVDDEFMPSEPVDGLGDAATYAPDLQNSYTVVVGDTLVDLAYYGFGPGMGGGGENRELGVDLLELILPKLGG